MEAFYNTPSDLEVEAEALNVQTLSSALRRLEAILLEDETSSSSCHGNARISLCNPSNSLQIPIAMNNTECGQDYQKYRMAERKRRENINEKFIALSALLPGLKKLNKESVLSETVNYVKQLEKRLTSLEAELSPVQTLPINELKISAENTHNSKRKNMEKECWVRDPEIEARVFNDNFSIRIHCPKTKGLLVKCVMELDKLHLTVTHASVLFSTDNALHLKFSGQMENECTLAVPDIVRALNDFFRRLN